LGGKRETHHPSFRSAQESLMPFVVEMLEQTSERSSDSIDFGEEVLWKVRRETGRKLSVRVLAVKDRRGPGKEGEEARSRLPSFSSFCFPSQAIRVDPAVEIRAHTSIYEPFPSLELEKSRAGSKQARASPLLSPTSSLPPPSLPPRFLLL